MKEHLGMININEFLFVYAKKGGVRCLGVEDARNNHDSLIIAQYKHTATINAALWIEAMCSGKYVPSDMLDELQFKP
jgi:hypothetical protein